MPLPARNRRAFLRTAGAAAGATLVSGTRVWAAPRFDLVLRGGRVIDGTGAPPFAADIGLIGDTVAGLGAIGPEQARRVLDVTGLQVAPGFIDIHSHSDGDILLYPTADSRVRQGVTTELTGNCGGSAAPLAGIGVDSRRREYREDGIEPSWTGVGSYLDLLERRRISINQALLVGQGTLRDNAVGPVDRPLSPAELEAVLSAVDEAMDQGAHGLSTGLEYVPGRYTPTAEIVAMARVAARRGGLYASHIRNEEVTLLEAVDEAIRVGREAGMRVQVSHLKASGRPNWGKQQGALDLIASARRDGVAVLADAYPYTAYSTSLTTLLSDAALEGGSQELMKRLADPGWRSRIRREVEGQMARELGDYGLIVIARTRTERNRPLLGQNLVQVAQLWGVEPVDAVLRLLEEEQAAISIVGHGMSPENLEKVLRHPLVMIGSDGVVMAPVGRAAEARPHPRSYGAFARVLGYYCRERRLFDLSEAIRKMTSLPADQIGLPDRGRLARGKKADIVVFDEAQVSDQATFEEPHRYAKGIVHVLVNGVPVVEDGLHTGARPGRALRKT